MVGAKAVEKARIAVSNGDRVSLWDLAYQMADDEFSDEGGLIPHWVFDEGDARIERYATVLPLSRDAARMDALRRSLAVYRMVFGQPRQDDLLEFILRETYGHDLEDLAAELTIDLSPPL